jgi:hypothetical protein
LGLNIRIYTPDFEVGVRMHKTTRPSRNKIPEGLGYKLCKIRRVAA